MFRDPSSHKGENGTVAVIGGSAHMHGAPLMSVLAAEASGVDLLFAAVPHCHAEVTKHASCNVQVYTFKTDTLHMHDVDQLLELLATVDCAVVGPGLDRTPDTLATIKTLIQSATCPLVLDASALQPWTLEAAAHRPVVLTPHLGELERMGITENEVADATKTRGITIHVKSPVDRIYDTQGAVHKVSGGNAGLTVGGTGDALAGVIAGLWAQGLPVTEACTFASRIIKRAGTELFATHGYAYRTADVIDRIPFLLRELPPTA